MSYFATKKCAIIEIHKLFFNGFALLGFIADLTMLHLACPFLIVHVFFVSMCAHSSCVCVCVCCAAPADLCLLPMEEGSCGRYTLRWYFNSHVQACRPFIYSGCEGNDNRFLHLEECEEVCLGEAEGTQTHTHTYIHTLVYARYWMYED